VVLEEFICLREVLVLECKLPSCIKGKTQNCVLYTAFVPDLLRVGENVHRDEQVHLTLLFL